MRLRILTALSAVLLIFAMAPVVSGGTQGSCSPVDTSRLMAWENAIGDTGDGNDVLWVCSNITDLSKVSHTLPGTCADGLFGSNDWNDCIGSVSTYLAQGWRVCFYRNLNFLPPIVSYVVGPTHGQRVNVGPGITSIQFSNGGC